MKLEKKIKIVRLEHELTQSEFAEMLDMPVVTIKSYEQGKREIHSKNLLKIVNHPTFSKYALWLMLDDFDGLDKNNEQVKPAHLDEILDTIG